MVRIMTDPSLRERLGGLQEPAELFDEDGRTLGRFVPAHQLPQPLPDDQCPFSAEELAAMRAEGGGRPFAEVWQALGQR